MVASLYLLSYPIQSHLESSVVLVYTKTYFSKHKLLLVYYTKPKTKSLDLKFY